MAEAEAGTTAPAPKADPQVVNTTAELPTEPAQPTSDPAEPGNAELEEAERKRTAQARIRAENRRANEATARAEAAEAELANLRQRQPPPAPQAAPRQEDFQDYDAYQRATARYEAAQVLAEREQQDRQRQLQMAAMQQAQQTKARIDQAAEAGREKYDDFDEVVFDQSLPITPAMRDAIVGSEVAADLAYHLAKNRKEVERLAQLPPLDAAREIGAMAVKMQAQRKSVSNAPAPPRQVDGRFSSNKKPEEMSVDEYRKWRGEPEIR